MISITVDSTPAALSIPATLARIGTVIVPKAERMPNTPMTRAQSSSSGSPSNKATSVADTARANTAAIDARLTHLYNPLSEASESSPA